MRKKVSGGGGRKEENGPLPPPPPPPLRRGRERGRCTVAPVHRVQGSWRGTGKGLMVNYVYKMVYLVKQMPCEREGERQRERQRESASVFVREREGARERECRVGHVSPSDTHVTSPLFLLAPPFLYPPPPPPSCPPFPYPSPHLLCRGKCLQSRRSIIKLINSGEWNTSLASRAAEAKVGVHMFHMFNMFTVLMMDVVCVAV